MNHALPANNSGGGSGLWAIPLALLALLGVLFFAFKPKQHVRYAQPNTLNTRGPGYQPPPTSYRPPQTNYPPTQGTRDVTPPTAGNASGYRQDKYRADANHQSDISGGGGTFGSDGSDFGGDERGGGGSFGGGGSDFEKGKPGGGRRNN
jgi:uncharacterized membrane protein YgcG